MAATKDMSVVSREYETSITSAWKNLVAGDIARMVRFARFAVGLSAIYQKEHIIPADSYHQSGWFASRLLHDSFVSSPGAISNCTGAVSLMLIKCKWLVLLCLDLE